MAQTREAAVRLTLAAGQFTASMRQLADNLNRQWERVGRAMQTHVNAGLKGAKASLSELGGAAKKAGPAQHDPAAAHHARDPESAAALQSPQDQVSQEPAAAE